MSVIEVKDLHKRYGDRLGRPGDHARRRKGRDPRTDRSQRRGQDDARRMYCRAAPAGQRSGAGPGPRPAKRETGAALSSRHPASGQPASGSDQGVGSAGPLQLVLRGACGLGIADRGARPAGEAQRRYRQALRRAETAPFGRPGDGRQSRHPDPGRADHRAGPEARRNIWQLILDVRARRHHSAGHSLHGGSGAAV